jgi:ribosomal protein L11 methyltransferase
MRSSRSAGTKDAVRETTVRFFHNLILWRRMGDTTKASSWFEASLAVGDPDVDVVTGMLAELGHDGSELVELNDGTIELRVFFQASDGADAERRVRELANALTGVATLLRIRALDESVWRDDWKRHFDRMTIGRNFEIFPPWDDELAALSQRTAIIINPGMAFGTGRHETTAGCLELLESSVRPGDAVLDLGCGSGILAIAAVKLGAGRVLGIDNDPEAISATHENAESNGVSDKIRIILGDGPPVGEEPFDLAVANILAEPLAEMASVLTSCVKPEGQLVLSGIESKRRALVEIAYGRESWRVTGAIERGGWVSLALERREDGGERDR